MSRSNNSIVYGIDGVNFSIEIQDWGIKEKFREHYKNYFSGGKPDFYVCIKHEDPSRHMPKFFASTEYRKGFFKLACDGRFIYIVLRRKTYDLFRYDTVTRQIDFYTLDSFEPITAILNLIPRIIFMLVSSATNKFVLHACAVLDCENASLFIAPSGGGKSTIARIAIDNGLSVLNDERVLACSKNGKIFVSNTPWYGEVRSLLTGNFFVKNAFFLQKTRYNSIYTIDNKQAIQDFFSNYLYFPISKNIVKRNIDFCFDFINSVNCYQLNFKPDINIREILDDMDR